MISRDDVQYIASLARIHLRGNEIEKLTKNLEDILLYIAKLKEVDIQTVEPTSHVLALKNVDREDIVRPSLEQKNVLNITSETHKGFFKVPKVLE